MPELLNNTPDKQPSTGGSMFSAEDIASLQASLEANRQQINTETNATIAEALRSGQLGKGTPDLEMPKTAGPRLDFQSMNPDIQNRVRAVRAERAARGIVDAPIDGLDTPPAAMQPMSDTEVAAIAAGPRVSSEAVQAHLANAAKKPEPAVVDNPYKRPVRHIYQETDGKMWTDEQWAEANAKDRAEQAKRGKKSMADQRAEYKSAKAEKDAADTELLDAMNPALREASLEKYGREGLLDMLKGTAEVPRYTGPDTEAATFTHATTGETMNQSEVEQRMSEAEAQRIGAAAGNLAENALTRKPFEEELIDDAEKGLIYRERGHLDDGLDMVIEVLPDGSLGNVEVIVKDDSTGEIHKVEVADPQTPKPEVTIDGESATEEQAPLVEAVLAEANAALENEPSELDKTTDSSEIGQSEVLTEEDTSDKAEQPLETLDNSPVVEQMANKQTAPAEKVPSPRLTPEQMLMRQQQDAMRFATSYIRSNPAFLEVFRSLGIDPNKLTPGDVQLTDEALSYVNAIQKQGIKPESMILRENPHANSTLGRAASESQELVKGLLRSMFKGKEPEQK